MRFAAALLALALAACSGPMPPTHGSPTRATGSTVMRPPPNAPPDPIGTTRPGNRSCTEDRDCKVGEACVPPDFTPGGGKPPTGSAASTTSTTSPATPSTGPTNPASPAAGSPGSPPKPPPASPTGSPAAPSSGSAAPGPALAGSAAPAAPAAPPASIRCQADAQCGGGQVCNAGTCAAPCTAASCGAGLECREGGHCMPTPCTDPRAAVCAQNFRCNTSSGACERQACTSRAQCDAGVCFQGRCFAHDAYCMPRT